MFLARLVAWSRNLLRWLVEPRSSWLCAAAVAVALAVSLRPAATELEIRASGLALQCLGLFTVAYGLHETRQLFRRPALFAGFKAWLSRFPHWHARVILMTGTSSLGATGFAARGEVWANVDPNAPLEDQVGALTSNVERLRHTLTAVQNDLDSRHREQADALTREEQERAQHDQEIMARLESAETGGIALSFVGVIWIFLGTLLSSLSPEIAHWRG